MCVDDIIVEFLIAWALSLFRSYCDSYGSFILSILIEALSTEIRDERGETGAFMSEVYEL